MAQKMALEVMFQYRQSLQQMERDINSVMNRVNAAPRTSMSRTFQDASRSANTYTTSMNRVSTAVQQSDGMLTRFTQTMAHNIMKMGNNSPRI